MKLTKTKLKRLIKEELKNLTEEEMMDDPLGGVAVSGQQQADDSKALEILDGITPKSPETKAALEQLRAALEGQGIQAARTFRGAM